MARVLTQVEYMTQANSLAAQIGVQFKRFPPRDTPGGLHFNPEARSQIADACGELRRLFPVARTLRPPLCLQASHANLLASMKRYDESVGRMLDVLQLIERGEDAQIVATHAQAQRLADEAGKFMRTAMEQSAAARC